MLPLLFLTLVLEWKLIISFLSDRMHAECEQAH